MVPVEFSASSQLGFRVGLVTTGVSVATVRDNAGDRLKYALRQAYGTLAIASCVGPAFGAQLKPVGALNLHT